MATQIQKLLSIASPSLVKARACLPDAPGVARPLLEELQLLLEERNGFYAFESALHVLPAGQAEGVMDLASWNASELFRSRYGDLAAGYFFFAEDAFGSQFAFAGEKVVFFDPETGTVEELAADLEGWAARLLDDYSYLTGHRLARLWQEAHGRLVPGTRLVPKVPFVLGGQFEVENLYATDAAGGMRLRGDLASQLRDLPDGTRVTFEIAE